MSDEIPEHYGAWEMPPDMPDSVFYRLGVASVMASPDNPEATLQIALTYQDCSTIAFAMTVMMRLFIETRPAAHNLIEKLSELGEFQGFFTKEV